MLEKRILQVNLDGTGGAYSLMHQIQKVLYPEFVFDYYWMGKFNRTNIDLSQWKSQIYEADLRRNRLIGHILLPFTFYRFIKENDYTIIHINGDTAFKLLVHAIPIKLAGCPCVVLHSHSSGINGDHKKLKLLTHNLCKFFLIRYSDELLTCSKEASEWMFPQASEKATMINNGVNLEKFKFNEETRKLYREELELKDNVLIGTVGNLTYQKYPEYLINILAQLDDKYKLIFVGDGSNRICLEQYVMEKGVSDRVIFYGSTNKVNEILNAFDIFIMTSRFEGLPVSAIEAQANGLPCILSDKITKEAKVLDECIYASIDSAVDKWVEIIKGMNISKDRKEATSIMKSNGFDISDSAKKLEEIYRRNWS